MAATMSGDSAGFVDLVSDTSTRPCEAMRRAMAVAEVGDEQRGEDPSVNALCRRVAQLLGKEDALFLPSGTMCNQIAVLVHCRPGDEVIAAEASHVITSEGAGAAVLAGAFVRPVPSDRGVFGEADLRAAVRKRAPKAPRSRLVTVEQTHNQGGGRVWPVETLELVAATARELGLALHMDGARLMNAAVAAGVDAGTYAGPFDTVWLDLSKGLGCPVGGVLAGDAGFIAEAWLWKHRLGGAMRQAGILAAAGLYALDHNVEPLADDHANARFLADRAEAVAGVRVDPSPVETNLVFLDVSGTAQAAEAIAARLQQQGIRMGVEGPHRMRAVTHRDVTRADCLRAADALAAAVARG
ncbi:GntG family PLP-dependent aldolase [Aquisalimonas lutea]|uniref:threonine aldolase family protein n=1 Tax=Aquisalimonas lutea TaxID=1327750 RepID=UPI0025B3B90E|nr:GntG family PLP-dependent aldolase [Aquisalimonas lutea]MDN3519423.1 GntG family PLP-dependent aldolase [Aquisalimonas lutea]